MKSKVELRRQLVRELPVCTDNERAMIVEKLAGVLSFSKSKPSALLYQAVKEWHEIDPSSLLDAFPNVDFDYIENTKNAVFPVKKYDVIIVPLLGFTSSGYRLGHGGGWYDRFLATQPQALKIGVGYENCLVDFNPEIHDVAMDVVVTEECIRDFRKR